MAASRRNKIGLRRRVEDEAEDEGGPEGLDLDDDSMTEGSIGTDDHDGADDSDTSNVDEVSPTSLKARKSSNGTVKTSRRQPSSKPAILLDAKTSTDTEIMLHGLTLSDPPAPGNDSSSATKSTALPKSPSAPVIVSSASAMRQPPESRENIRRNEHDEYRKKRDEDPAFVPNRGSFFMHDHRHAGPAANGFRPFGRGRGRGGGGRGGIGGPFSPMHQIQRPGDPTTSFQWTHDMHEAVAEPIPRRPRHVAGDEGPPNGTGFIPTREPNPIPINRTLSCEKHIGNAQVRIFLPNMKAPIIKPGVAVKQYTNLPDHRPPLRRDKPVRISLPNRPPRYIYPAVDRSFIFIPRAMRPNQQRVRGKPRSGFSSAGGFSRRTSVFGGSYYNGSTYTPSVGMSRRSSFAQDRDMFSPTGSAMSRPAVPVETSRPIVRLPPSSRPDLPTGGPGPGPFDSIVVGQYNRPDAPESSISDLPQPQTHPLPQKPAFQENRHTDIPMHQPRPQKNISVADIETPSVGQGPSAYQQAFHQQVPMPVPNANGYPKDPHSRHLSHHSTGTPLSQIPERAIHAAPFQPVQTPAVYTQQAYYNQQPQPQPQQTFYYPPQTYSGPNMAQRAAAPAFVPPGQGPPGSFTPQNQPDPAMGHGGIPASASMPNMVAQEANGMVYYIDTSQFPPPVNAYQPYSGPQNFQPGMMGMGGMVTPSPDGYYYPQGMPGVVYYQQ